MCKECITSKGYWKYMLILVGFSALAMAAVFILEWLS